jgi:glutamine synthetase adenylyltransferase
MTAAVPYTVFRSELDAIYEGLRADEVAIGDPDDQPTQRKVDEASARLKRNKGNQSTIWRKRQSLDKAKERLRVIEAKVEVWERVRTRLLDQQTDLANKIDSLASGRDWNSNHKALTTQLDQVNDALEDLSYGFRMDSGYRKMSTVLAAAITAEHENPDKISHLLFYTGYNETYELAPHQEATRRVEGLLEKEQAKFDSHVDALRAAFSTLPEILHPDDEPDYKP